MTTPANPHADLVTWLRQQLDDDERIAWAVADHRQRPGELRWEEASPEREPGLVGDQLGNVVTFGGAGNTSRWHAEHIARHDPARVLAEVDAKRRIVDSFAASTEPLTARTAEKAVVRMVLKLLALPYADREGFREEWKP